MIALPRAVNGRPRGFIDWKPHKKTAALIAQVQAVLDEYQAHLPLTLRQVFYRLVGNYGYDETERAYNRQPRMKNHERHEPEQG